MTDFAHEKLAVWTGGRWTRIPGSRLTSFGQDTRKLSGSEVFVALKTDKRDGHDFLTEAAQGGAAAALVARVVSGSDLPQLVVDDPLAAFQRIAREHRREFHGTVVGVTGSAGKTSTKDLLQILLGGTPGVFATEGNLNNFIGVPLTLAGLSPSLHRAAVIEAGISVPGEMATLAEMIEPDHSVVTMVGPAHLEQLGSLEGVAAEKSRLPAANRPGGLAVFPASCLAFEPFRALPNQLVLVPATEDMVRGPGRTLGFTVLHRPERTEVTLNGRRTFVLRRVTGGMAQNAALALALASELGVTDADLQVRLAAWAPSKWRGELQQVGDAVVYSDFYNANPASMADALAMFHAIAPASEPRLYVIGCMEELGSEAAMYHRALGRSLNLRESDRLLVTGTLANEVCTGVLEQGDFRRQIQIVSALETIAAVLAEWRGAVFVKGSRRYQLEQALNGAVAREAAHA